MYNKVRVSVCCLAFNHGKYIKDCLEGFVNQKTNFKYEVIVHDDASSDNTAEIIREYADKYPDVIKPVLQKENQYSQGISIFEKFIFPLLNGDYIALCEGDDYWCNNYKLQKQVDILDSDKDILGCVHQVKSIDSITGKSSFVSKIRESGVVDNRLVFSSDGPVYHTSSLIYRKSLLDKIPEFCRICKSVGDYPWGIRIALEGKIYFINEVMSVYRMYTEGSWSLRKRNSENNIGLYMELIDMLNGADKESSYKYHEYFDIPILNYEYRCWKSNPQRSILCNERFYKLKLSKKIKMVFRILLRFIGN